MMGRDLRVFFFFFFFFISKKNLLFIMTVILLFIKGRSFIEKNEKTKRTIYHDL